MKISRRNTANAQAKAEKRAVGKKTSRYAAKVAAEKARLATQEGPKKK